MEQEDSAYYNIVRGSSAETYAEARHDQSQPVYFELDRSVAGTDSRIIWLRLRPSNEKEPFSFETGSVIIASWPFESFHAGSGWYEPDGNEKGYVSIYPAIIEQRPPSKSWWRKFVDWWRGY